jgi:hypothetical protein
MHGKSHSGSSTTRWPQITFATAAADDMLLETKIVGVHRSPDKKFAGRQNVMKPTFTA